MYVIPVRFFGLISGTVILAFLISSFDPLTPMSDQKRINIKQTSDKKKRKCQLLVDPIPNSPNQHHENCAADSQENY